MNYEELCTHAPVWLNSESNAELRRIMPQAVRRAENRLIEELPQDVFKAEISGVAAALEPILDFRAQAPREIRSVTLFIDGQSVVLSLRALDFLRALYPDLSQAGVPEFYAEDGAQFRYRLFPLPEVDTLYAAEIIRRPPPLGPGNITNVLTERFGNLLEQAVLRQAAMFLKNPSLFAMHDGEYGDELALGGANVERTKRDATEQRPIDSSNRAGA